MVVGLFHGGLGTCVQVAAHFKRDGALDHSLSHLASSLLKHDTTMTKRLASGQSRVPIRSLTTRSSGMMARTSGMAGKAIISVSWMT